MSGATCDPYLLIIRSGPIYFIERNLGHFGDAFGREYDGEILTWSDELQESQTGRISIRAYDLGSRSIVRRVSYILWLLWRAMRVRWILRRRLIVITYDPFQSGVAGVLIKWMTGARFICEVNGVYGDPAILLGSPNMARARQRQAVMLSLGSFILRRADGIKLLFPDQLIGFKLGADPPPRYAFHDMINAPLFQPSGRDSEKLLLFVGHPFLIKGVDILLKAFNRVAPEFPDWKLILVGWGIEMEARSLEFPRSQVNFLMTYPQEYLAELMELASGLVLPSRTEGMGRVLLEAAFLGRPRIGSTAGGIPHVIEDEVDGLLFELGNEDDLVRVLREFLSNASLRKRMGRNARRRALSDFTNEEYVRRYKGIFSDLGFGSAEGDVVTSAPVF